MSKSKTHLLAEKISGKDIDEEQFVDVLDRVAASAKIVAMMNDCDIVYDLPDDEYVEILDFFDEEEKMLAAMLMADLAGYSFGRNGQ